MGSILLKRKQILAVDDERDVLDILQEELEAHQAKFDRASTYEDAIQRMSSLTYDLVILDIMGVRGLELLEYAVARNIPVVVLTAHALSPKNLKESIELGARAYLPKDQLGQVTPFLEDVLSLSYRPSWKSLFARLDRSFSRRFGPDWRESEKAFWDKFDKELEVSDLTSSES